MLSVLKTADCLRRHLNRVTEQFGLSLEQYNVLRILRGAGPSGLPTLEVASRMIEQTPAITRLMDKLETKRLVKRQRNTSDRRQVFCWITDEGLALLAQMEDPINRVEDVVTTLNDAEISHLIVFLAKIRESSH